jgi:hypothetical protein
MKEFYMENRNKQYHLKLIPYVFVSASLNEMEKICFETGTWHVLLLFLLLSPHSVYM